MSTEMVSLASRTSSVVGRPKAQHLRSSISIRRRRRSWTEYRIGQGNRPIKTFEFTVFFIKGSMAQVDRSVQPIADNPNSHYRIMMLFLPLSSACPSRLETSVGRSTRPSTGTCRSGDVAMILTGLIEFTLEFATSFTHVLVLVVELSGDWG
ncbi:hypothetical protein PtA15_8A87 [Puccinia triticina]|uniref:Uncharacterized protein n=1 Tax=Puccinia triticina TaxID=208348 RepID=A0ABY7CPL0_9BASI|nr:uncharacterized protein PtA15_8A87 [Puccinia triticina]WAQ87186.1 hypothetical protein PtA15_8A87 [Puccinia triticina]